MSDRGSLSRRRRSGSSASDDPDDPRSYRTPLLYPHRYFERRDRPSLGVAAGVIFAQALVVGVGVYLFVSEVATRLDVAAGVRDRLASEAISQLIGFLFLVFVGWFLLAAVFHVFVWFADGDRGFGTTLAVVGEAELAPLVLTPITIVLLLGAASQVPQDPEAAVAFLERTSSFNTPALFLVSLVGQLWAAVITGVGLGIGHDVPVEKMLALAVVLATITVLFL